MTDFVISPELLSSWEIDPLHSINVLPPSESAPAGNVAFVETESGGCYVLKRRTGQFIRPQEYRLLKTLAAAGVPVAVPILTRSGEPYVQVGDECFDLSPRLAGTVYTDHYAPGALKRAGLIGEAIARLHLGLRRCDAIISMPDMDLPGDMGRCRPVVCSVWPAGQRSPEPILDELEAGLADCFTALPQQLIHRDAHPGNMLFQDGRLSGWIDFELTERGPRLFDLCYCSTSLLMNGLDDPAKRRAWPGLVRGLVAGYGSVSPLTPVERSAIRWIQMAIGVLFIAWLSCNHYPVVAAKNIEALVWLYQNPYEL